MKKLIACAVLIGATCAFAEVEDSYLFWMVNSNPTIEGGTMPAGSVGVKVSAIKGSDWTYGGGDYLMLNAYSDDGTVGSAFDQMPNLNYGSPLFAKVTGHLEGDWTYYVELYNDGRIFARSEGLPYNADSIVRIAGMAKPGTLWQVSKFVSATVPEPSSGLMLLLGVAGLALRRRKQIAA